MRELADEGRIRTLMQEIGRASREPTSIYFTGGVTAVLYGWRGTTIDVDLRIEPERDDLLREIVRMKERLAINIELASPDQFVPVAAGWQDRSPHIAQIGRVSFRHFDLVAQALAKIERGHKQDLADVNAIIERGLVNAAALWNAFRRGQADLHRYPAIDPAAYEAALRSVAPEPPEPDNGRTSPGARSGR